MNVGKQSIVIDLKHPEAVALARRHGSEVGYRRREFPTWA
jgi:hypothetical protein